MEVRTAVEAAPAWLCPECGHGSAELRDERAHLDAHRQLKAFFREWEGEPVAAVPPKRPRALVSTLIAVVVLLASVGVFSRINRAPDEGRAPVPALSAPAPAPAATPAPSPSPRVDPVPVAESPAPAPVARRPVRAPVSATPAPTPTPTTVAPAAPPAPVVPAPVDVDTPPVVTPPAPVHLVNACVLGLCVTLL